MKNRFFLALSLLFTIAFAPPVKAQGEQSYRFAEDVFVKPDGEIWAKVLGPDGFTAGYWRIGRPGESPPADVDALYLPVYRDQRLAPYTWINGRGEILQESFADGSLIPVAALVQPRTEEGKPLKRDEYVPSWGEWAWYLPAALWDMTGVRVGEATNAAGCAAEGARRLGNQVLFNLERLRCWNWDLAPSSREVFDDDRSWGLSYLAANPVTAGSDLKQAILVDPIKSAWRRGHAHWQNPGDLDLWGDTFRDMSIGLFSAAAFGKVLGGGSAPVTRANAVWAAGEVAAAADPSGIASLAAVAASLKGGPGRSLSLPVLHEASSPIARELLPVAPGTLSLPVLQSASSPIKLQYWRYAERPELFSQLFDFNVLQKTAEKEVGIVRIRPEWQIIPDQDSLVAYSFGRDSYFGGDVLSFSMAQAGRLPGSPAALKAGLLDRFKDHRFITHSYLEFDNLAAVNRIRTEHDLFSAEAVRLLREGVSGLRPIELGNPEFTLLQVAGNSSFSALHLPGAPGGLQVVRGALPKQLLREFYAGTLPGQRPLPVSREAVRALIEQP